MWNRDPERHKWTLAPVRGGQKGTSGQQPQDFDDQVTLAQVLSNGPAVRCTFFHFSLLRFAFYLQRRHLPDLRGGFFQGSRLKVQGSRLETQDSRLKTQDSRSAVCRLPFALPHRHISKTCRYHRHSSGNQLERRS